MAMPRPRNAVSLLGLVVALALLLRIAPARAQVVLSAFSQDQPIRQPSSSVTLTATLTQPQFQGDWHVQSGTITIDGTDHPAVVTFTSGTLTNLSYVWDVSSAGNPSEHTISASAQVQFEYEGPPSGDVLTLSSTSPPPPAAGPYTDFYGDGREADLVVADMHLKSLGFTGNIALTQDATTPVSTPEFTWDPASNSLLNSSPSAYVQGSNVGFTLTLCDSTGAALTGSATTGYTLKAQADPNAINAATGQPIPPLTLYDNTTPSPIVPTTFSGSAATVSASVALSGYVARYTLTLSALNFYVEFTHVTPTPTWGMGGSSVPSGNILYAVVATPTAPMTTPWVPVLEYACKWATGATNAASATTALTNAEWNNCTYNESAVYTDLSTDPSTNGYPQDGQEVFSLQRFLNAGRGNNQLTGDCRVFADFLCCLSNAVGVTPLKVQRSALAYDIRHNSDNHCYFTTKYGFQAPPVQGVYNQTVAWVYHQWTTSNVYDGASVVSTSNSPVTYPTSVIPLDNKSITDYHDTFVDTTISPCFWQPQTAFTPSVVN